MMNRRRGYNQPTYARLIPAAGGLAFESNYDAGLVAEFKRQIPDYARQWDGARKRWLVDPQYGAICAQLADRFLGISVAVPAVAAVPMVETRLIKLEYLGRTKERGNEQVASGWVDGGWTVTVTETALREWFDAVPQRPGELPTLYAVLAIKPMATADEIRSAYRRMARQWHPDICHEPDAADQFKTINHAYQVLNNELQRRKYDVGLALQASLDKPRMAGPFRLGGYQASATGDPQGYRPPLRCGWVLAEGTQSLGRFVVSKILQWEDVTDDCGRVMVSSWPRGGDTFEVVWQ